MKIVAIVERRAAHRYLYVPALGTGSPLPDRGDPEVCAAEFVATTLGVPAADLQVTLHFPRLGETVVPMPPSDVEILHEDSVWRAAVQVGWLRHWRGPWGPLITYTAADGRSWTRALPVSRVREQVLDHAAALPVQGRRVPDGLPVP